MLLETVDPSANEGGVGLETETAIQVFAVARVFWRAVDPSLFLLLSFASLLLSERFQRQAVQFVRFLLFCWGSLLREVGSLMPFHPRPVPPERDIESLRRRVNSLAHLLSESVETALLQRAAEPAVGVPVLNSRRWELLGSFVAGLWCGCIVSLLALCTGVYIGHSL